MSNHLVIYTKPKCIQCKMTIKLLKELNYKYIDNYYGNKQETNVIDIQSNDENKRKWSEKKIESLKRKTNLKTMPIIKVRDDNTGELLDTWGGFQPSKIKYWHNKNK